MIVRRAGLSATFITFALLLGTPSAFAGHRQMSIVEDDARLVLGSQSARDKGLADLTALGADTVRVVVSWNRVAPSPLGRTHPAGFDGSDPAAYPPEYWDRYDSIVRSVTAIGKQVLLSPASPIPYWASDCNNVPVSTLRVCRPNLTQFKRFVQALGTRYDGEYADENQGNSVLPRVSLWSVWNEPNQGGWLQPQYETVRGRAVAQSPVIYRGLVRSAISALHASGHSSDDILLGETAPLGRTTGALRTRPIAPGRFLRDALCVSQVGKALTGSASAALDCRGFKRLAVTGISHHPYTRGGSSPPTTKGTDNEITISSGSRLKRLIAQAVSHNRIPRGTPIYYTEFGFQTNPPDAIFGVTLTQQAAFINQSDWIAYNDPAVRSVAQYQLRDEPKLSGFQTGLRFVDGSGKPSFIAYRFPVWVTPSGSSSVRVWGQLRPPADGASETVDIQNAGATGEFETVASERTANVKGFIDVVLPKAGPRWRLSWTPPSGGPAITSRVARVVK